MKPEQSFECLKLKAKAGLWDELPWEFTWSWDDYRRNNTAKNSLNAMLGTKFKAVYTSGSHKDNDYNSKSIDWSGQRLLLVREDGKIIEMSNSEWAFFEVAK